MITIVVVFYIYCRTVHKKGGYKMDEVRKFAEALRNDPRAKELVNGLDIPADDEKGVDVYLDLAKKLGFSISREDLLNWEQAQREECKARSEKAEASMEEALDSEEMSMVAGGKDFKGCESTFNKGEWCWFSDSCKKVINVYHCTALTDF